MHVLNTAKILSFTPLLYPGPRIRLLIVMPCTWSVFVSLCLLHGPPLPPSSDEFGAVNIVFIRFGCPVLFMLLAVATAVTSLEPVYVSIGLHLLKAVL